MTTAVSDARVVAVLRAALEQEARNALSAAEAARELGWPVAAIRHAAARHGWRLDERGRVVR